MTVRLKAASWSNLVVTNGRLGQPVTFQGQSPTGESLHWRDGVDQGTYGRWRPLEVGDVLVVKHPPAKVHRGQGQPFGYVPAAFQVLVITGATDDPDTWQVGEVVQFDLRTLGDPRL